jgi:arsenical pump membrane protein
MLALAIFIATLGLVIWQPRGLGIGWSAMAGAVVDLALGVIHWRNIPVVWHIVWNARLTPKTGQDGPLHIFSYY